MRNLISRIDLALNEMAQLKSYVATPNKIKKYQVADRKTYKKLGFAKGNTRDEAISAFLAERDLDDSYAERLIAFEHGSGNFSAGDIKSTTDPNTQKQIEEWLNANQDQYVWHILIGQNHTDVEPDPKAITFAKTGNVGRDTLQPHMILHTVAHAVLEGDHSDFEAQRYIREFWADVVKRLPENQKPQHGNPNDIVIDAATQFLHFKSALNWQKLHHSDELSDSRKKAIKNLSAISIQEVVNDMMAIYIRNGRIKIAPNQYTKIEMKSRQLEKFRANVEKIFRKALDKCVGKVITGD